MISILHNGSFVVLVALVLAASLLACGDPKVNLALATAEEKFRIAMKDYENEDYKEAGEKFNTIVLQEPTSEFADDAQFYIGECHFHNGEFLLAAFQFNRLRSNFPNSPYYRRALLRTAEAYSVSSPSFERDQSDTRTAIAQYEAYVRLYPEDSLTSFAQSEIHSLRSKLARKEYSIAEQYARLEDYKAAIIYYDRVIELYPDTEYNHEAIVARIRALQAMDRDQDARDAINQYLQQHPGRSALPQLRQMLNDLDGRMDYPVLNGSPSSSRLSE